MALFKISCVADIPSPQRAVAIRDWMKNNIPSDVQVVSWDASQTTQGFAVTAVDTKTKKPLTKNVEATDTDAAAAQVATDSVIVADVTPSP